jgi:hypothetical protein
MVVVSKLAKLRGGRQDFESRQGHLYFFPVVTSTTTAGAIEPPNHRVLRALQLLIHLHLVARLSMSTTLLFYGCSCT